MEKVELYRAANDRVSFHCEAMLDHCGKDGRIYNKITITLVERDGDNHATCTVSFFLDIPAAKVLCSDLWRGTLPEYKSYKKTGNGERALNVAKFSAGYNFQVLNRNGEDYKLYFQLTYWQAREMAISVLDHLRAFEQAKMIYALKNQQ